MLLSRPLLSLAALALGAIVQAETPAPTTTIDTGALRGSEEAGVQAFKGIPFAAPPVEPLRWHASRPAAHWSGVRQATAYGHD